MYQGSKYPQAESVVHRGCTIKLGWRGDQFQNTLTTQLDGVLSISHNVGKRKLIAHHHTGPDTLAASVVHHHTGPDTLAASVVHHHTGPDTLAASVVHHHTGPDTLVASVVHHHRYPSG